jgi:hypothetical protein
MIIWSHVPPGTLVDLDPRSPEVELFVRRQPTAVKIKGSRFGTLWAPLRKRATHAEARDMMADVPSPTHQVAL